MSITDTFKPTTKSTLKNLVQTLNDGHEGYKQSAENVKNPALKELFAKISLQRSKMAGELESELLTLGEKDPQDEGTSLRGKVHRGWIDLKSAIVKGDDHAVLAEAERGEDVAKEAFGSALETDLPANIREIVARQAIEVKAAHDAIRDLRDATKKA
jgi:uncharacterized protein (TIGR02284 family)